MPAAILEFPCRIDKEFESALSSVKKFLADTAAAYVLGTFHSTFEDASDMEREEAVAHAVSVLLQEILRELAT